MKKRLKTLFAFVLAVCLSLTFTACDFGGKGGNGGGTGGGNGGALPNSTIYVREEDGKLVKGLAIEMGTDGKCYFWDGGEKDLYTYTLSGTDIVMTGANSHVEDDVFTGTIENGRLTLSIYGETWIFVKYTGTDWKGEESGGSGSSSGDPSKPGTGDEQEESIEFVSFYMEPGETQAEAIELCLAKEFKGDGLVCEYVSHTVVEHEEKLVATNMPNELKAMSPVLEELSVKVKFAGNGGELSDMFPVETVEQTIYTAKIEYADDVAYFPGTVAPKDGERMTNSYAKLLTEYQKYENSTLTIEEYASENGGAMEFEYGKRVEMTRLAAHEGTYYTKSGFDAETPDSETYYFINEDEKETKWSRTFSAGNPSEWNKTTSSYMFLDHKEREFTLVLTQRFMPLPAGFYTKSATDFAIMADSPTGKVKMFPMTVKNGYITGVQAVGYGTKTKLTKIALSDFGTTQVSLPQGAEAGEDPSEKTILKVGLMATANDPYAAVLKDIGKELGITVRIAMYNANNFDGYLSAAVITGDMPDVIFLPTNFKTAMLVREQMLADMDELLDSAAKADIAMLDDTVANKYVYDKEAKTWGTGTTYALPVGLVPRAFGYNKTLIEERSDEVLSALRRVNNNSKLPWEMDWATENYTVEQFHAMVSVLATDNTKSATNLPDIETMARMFGCSLLDTSTGTVLPDREEFEDLAHYYCNMRYMLSGRGDMFFAGRGYFTSNCSLDLIDNEVRYGLDKCEWGVMAIPGEYTAANYVQGMGVYSGSKNKELAAKLIAGLLKRDVQLEIAKSNATLPLRKDIEEDDLSNDTAKVFLRVARVNAYAPLNAYYDVTWLNEIESYVENNGDRIERDFENLQQRAQEHYNRSTAE